MLSLILGLAQSVMDLVGTEIPVEEGQHDGSSMERYNWRLDIFLYEVNGEQDLATPELVELSGIELYWIDLNISWQSGRRERDMHFSTIKSRLANRR